MAWWRQDAATSPTSLSSLSLSPTVVRRPLVPPCQLLTTMEASTPMAPEARALEFVDAACDAWPPLQPPPPQIVEVVHVNDSDLERPLMTPREMAAAVAAIMMAILTASPSAVRLWTAYATRWVVSCQHRSARLTFPCILPQSSTRNCVGASSTILKRHSDNFNT